MSGNGAGEGDSREQERASVSVGMANRMRAKALGCALERGVGRALVVQTLHGSASASRAIHPYCHPRSQPPRLPLPAHLIAGVVDLEGDPLVLQGLQRANTTQHNTLQHVRQSCAVLQPPDAAPGPQLGRTAAANSRAAYSATRPPCPVCNHASPPHPNGMQPSCRPRAAGLTAPEARSDLPPAAILPRVGSLSAPAGPPPLPVPRPCAYRPSPSPSPSPSPGPSPGARPQPRSPLLCSPRTWS